MKFSPRKVDKEFIFKVCMVAALIGILGGCIPQTQRAIAPPPPSSHVLSGAPDLSRPSDIVSSHQRYTTDANIELPNNYDTNYFRKVRIAAYFEQINFEDPSKPGSLDNHALNTLLENEISRTKRFIVYSRQSVASGREVAWQVMHNTVDDEQNIARNPEWLLEVTSVLGRNKRSMRGYEEAIFYIRISSKLIDYQTMEIVHAFPPITAKSEPKKYFLSIGGKWIGGFKIYDEGQLMEAYSEAANRAIAVLVNRVGNYFPCGGRVIGYYNDRFSINKGIRDGFAMKQIVVLYTSMNGVDIPISSGEVTPADTKGSGRILHWKDDPLAQEIRRKLTINSQDYLNTHEIYAVSVGMPEQWEY